ncbi:MAG: chromosomal replication initiator protein DnaA [Thermodesulfobacteriota bacterium]
MDSLWKKAKTDLKTHIPFNNYMMWIEPLEFESSREDTLVLTCPNAFSKKWIEGNYEKLIQEKVCGLCGRPLHIRLEISAQTPGPGKPADAEQAALADPDQAKTKTQLLLPDVQVRPATGRVLKKDFTFENFVVGNHNDFAYTAVLSLGARNPSANRPLFLSSKPGMGKSHLAQALGHHTLKTWPGCRVYYTTAEDFSNEMVYAYNTKSIGTFKKKYRTGFDMLLLDDIHALAGKERTQAELATVVDYMMDANRKVLFAGCCLPAEIPKMNEQLKSRLSCGLITTMERPDFSTRVRILQKKARVNGYGVPQEIIEYLADVLTEDVRQLESGLSTLAVKSSLLGVPVDRDLAESIIKSMAVRADAITLDVIKKIVCREYGLLAREIDSRSRQHRVAWPRQVAIYLSRRYTDHSLKSIGRSYNRYHATVIHAINTVEQAMKANRSVGKEVEYIIEKIESGKL